MLWNMLWILAWVPHGEAVRVEEANGVKLVAATIKENTAVQSLIVDLTKSFSFPGVRRQFSLQAAGSELIEVSEDGEVTLAKPVDYETLCLSNVQPCVFKSKIAVLPQEVFESILFELEIENENDNAPNFELSSVAVSINENHPAGKRIEVPELVAFDMDVEDSKGLKYDITPKDLFKIENEDGRTFLVAKKELDREQMGYLTGIVEVSDPGGKTAQAEVEISITDANDNAPIFDEDVFEIDLLEGRPLGSVVFTASAFDRDIGVNGEVSYKIVGAEPIQAKYLFEIEPASGNVRTIKDVRRQDFATIRLKIKATDGGSPSMSSECDVVIKIMDENDHDPRITLTPIRPSDANKSIAIVDENEPVGSFIVWVEVGDVDFDANGETDVQIEPEEIFQMNPEDGVITSRREFDREQRDSYALTVTACDRGTPKRCSSVEMPVHIGDVNDNAPKMEQKVIRANLRENIAVGSKLLSVRASDADHPAGYGKLVYDIAGGDGVFGINATTGQMILSDELDYETKTAYQLTVTASDPDGQSDTTIVEVTVLNVNDNRPVIAAPELVKINPGSDLIAPIATIRASDADGPMPILALSGESAHLFQLVHDELFVMVNVTRDFAEQLVVTATDAEDHSSVVEFEMKIVAKRDWSAVGAGIACGILMFLLVVALVLFRNCAVRRYKLYDRISQSQTGKPIVNRADEIVHSSVESMRKKSISVLSEKESNSLLDGANSSRSGSRPKSGIDTDSGRGESSSETHSNKLDNSTVLGQWCQAECLTLGHSDACWLPRGALANHYIVEVTSSSQQQPTALSVWEETSDYSSHGEADSSQNSSSQNSKNRNVSVIHNEGVIV